MAGGRDRAIDGREPADLRLAIAALAPLALAALAFGLWWLGDRLVQVGPLDRAAFGWLVVVPTWLAAPVVAGSLWRDLGTGRSRLVALVVAVAIGSVAAYLLWQAVTGVACADGPTRTPAGWVLPSLLVGGVIGAGVALSGLAAAIAARARRPWSTIAIGVGAELPMLLVAVVLATPTFLGPMCNRPGG